ncbi:MAG: pyrroline-5-carboxylate reductase [Saprospiraceae bacterium]|nr:pyrroline-5-carboxylate reductase [Saprospiraceae bacterium]MBK6566624.1 pyrroline-5-carboxylate reductase [Saprospiraceae bacterium]MBK8819730.1 pyrroline-5-carboxylate reductase [Saprospiraceae bacterium]
MKIIIIGGGNMGLTYARAFINSHVISPSQLIILEKDKKEHLEQLRMLNLAQIHTDPAIIKEADLIILAVKPQDALSLFDDIAGHVEVNQVILSIMAGIKIQTIREKLKTEKIIRAMPNLPSQIGFGMTAFAATEAVSRFEQGAIQNLLATTGKTLSLENEDLIDAVTAISGSGPAYVYYFMDSMIQAAAEMGLKLPEAELLVKQTFFGALSLYQQNSLDCKEWIKKVASKGGTTEAAIRHFEQSDLNGIIKKGTIAALQRARELGQ